MKLIKVDGNGMFIEDIIVDEKPSNMENLIKIPCPEGFYKPKWNGQEWIEGLTQNEIDELNNQPKEPTKEELIEQELANTNALILELTELIMGGM